MFLRNSREYEEKIMQKQIPVKRAAVRFSMGMLAAVAVLVTGCGKSKKDSFRSVQIYELEGTAQIERQESGVVNAVENLYLEAQDKVSVAAESNMRLKLDDDKYVLAEENTVFSIQAEGTAEDSLTTIALEKGAITNELQNSLSKDSLYEVVTPNSVMAVRGTVFRVEVMYDENGEIYTKVTTFEGKVSAQLKYADGTYGEEETVEAGNEAIIHRDEVITEFLRGPGATDYSELPAEVLLWLSDLIDRGTHVEGITKEELDRLLSGEKEAGDEASEQDGGSKSGREKKPSGEKADSANAGTSTGSRREGGAGNNGNAGTGDVGSKWSGGVAGNSGNTGNPGGVGNTGNTGNIGNTGNSGNSGNSGGGGNAGDAGNSGGGGNAGDAGNSGGGGGSSGGGGNSGGGGGSGNPDDDKKSYTVTFTYQGSTFATQTVENGEKASAPKLMPSARGEWDFDFSQSIKKDTTITWKE